MIPELFGKWNVRPKGIIHIGAHTCEEYEIYKNQAMCENILWIEANPEMVKRTEHMFQNVHQSLVSDVTGKEHLIEHPSVIEERRIKLKTITLEDFLNTKI